MQIALYNEKILVRNIERFSKQDTSGAITKANEKHEDSRNLFITILSLIKTLGSVIRVNILLKRAISVMKNKQAKDLELFKNSDFEAQENILIKWERLNLTIKSHSDVKPKKVSFFAYGIEDKIIKINNLVENYINNMINELYPNINQPLSQDYLKDLHERSYKHLPQDMLEDLISSDNAVYSS